MALPLLVCCDKPQSNRKSDETKHAEDSFGVFNEQIERMRQANAEEFSRRWHYLPYPSLEDFLGKPDAVARSPGSTILVFASMIDVDSNHRATVIEVIAGAPPSDLATRSAHSMQEGRYLIGSVMPEGGWRIHRAHSRLEFCVKIEPDGRSFKYCYNDELQSDMTVFPQKAIEQR